MGKVFSLIQNAHTDSGIHLASCSMFIEIPSSEGKATVE
jgi:hypothetical protein